MRPCGLHPTAIKMAVGTAPYEQASPEQDEGAENGTTIELKGLYTTMKPLQNERYHVVSRCTDNVTVTRSYALNERSNSTKRFS